MPHKTDSITLADPFLNRRVKMLPCQKERCTAMYGAGCSITSLAKIFSVNKRTIQFLLFPERLKKNVELRHDRGGSNIYYSKEQHTVQVREHRQYKNKVLKA